VEQIHAVWSLLTGDAVFAFTNRAHSARELKRPRGLAGSVAEYADDAIATWGHINQLCNAILERGGNPILCDVYGVGKVWRQLKR
jgi:hypothetical protein